MIEPRLVLCSGLDIAPDDPRRDGRKVLTLDSLGADPNVNIKLEDVAHVLLKHLTSRLVDLLEIAAYVFSADTATRRGTQWADGYSTEAWSRDFHFVIPVRDQTFWNSVEVRDLLATTLMFLSNDRYCFDFPKLSYDRPAQEYLDLEWDDWPIEKVDRVNMFSGGLDSLAGAAAMAAAGQDLVLVSHRSVSILDKRQRELFEDLQKTYSHVKMVHIPIWVNKQMHLGREATQRTRSFLYAAIGTVVAESLGARGINFFENGTVSLNLPIADEVLRARASRTTHPHALTLLSQLCALVVSRDFDIDNPFIFNTKTEVVEKIAENGAGHLISKTCSCVHTMFKSKTQWHCGTCSQCIDRRIAILAAGQEQYDSEMDYMKDVFIGSRKGNYERNIAVDYVRHANELRLMDERDLSTKFNLELTRAARHFPHRRVAAQKFVDMHKRHAESVCLVFCYSCSDG